MGKNYIVERATDSFEHVNGAEMVIFGLGSLEFYAPDGELLVGYAAGQWQTVVEDS